MNTNPDSEREDRLLNAVLGDEDWKAANADFKRQALGAFHARQRLRRLTRGAGSILALAAVIAGAVYWAGDSAKTPPQVTAARSNESQKPPVIQPPAVHYLTDQELLASFPKGSCFIAEVDGKKKLVFLNAKLEQEYMAKSTSKTQ